jgi:hypothetical protein
LGDFSPFRNWDKAAPTASLSWYDAYNGVKHDREREFERATLENLANGLAACAIMLMAQFGWLGLGYVQNEEQGLLSYFSFVAMPDWPLSEQYIDYTEDSSGHFIPEDYAW